MTRFALLLALAAIPVGSGELSVHPHSPTRTIALAPVPVPIPSVPPSHLPRAKWPTSNMTAKEFDDQYSMDQDDDDDYATPDTMTERESDMY